MAEKIKLLELGIDADAILKTTADLKNVLDNAKESLDKLKKSGDTSSEAYVKQQAKVNQLNEEYRTSQRELTKLTSLEDKKNLSIKEARSLLSIVTSQWAEQADLYGENSKQAQALAKTKLELTEQLKKEEKATGDTTRNVGNYSEGMKEAINDTRFFGSEVTTVTKFLGLFGGVFSEVKSEAASATKQITQAAKGTEGLTKAQKAQAIATNVASGALKLFRVALISTGIGAIVVLLGSLVAYFATTQKGIDKVNKALTPLKVAFQTLFGVLQQVGEALSTLFTLDGIKAFGKGIIDFVLAPFRTTLKVLGAVGKIITGDLNAGMNDLKQIGNDIKDSVGGVIDSIKNGAREMSETMKEAYNRGLQIAELQVQIESNEIDLIKRRSELNLITKEQNKIAEDITKTDKERIAAAKEATEAQNELLRIEQNLLDKRIEKLKLEQESNDTSREDFKELAELEAQRNEKATAAAEIQTTLQNKLNTIEQQRTAKSLKAQDEEIKKSKLILDLFIEQNKVKAQTLEKEVEIAEKVRDRKLQILAEEFNIGKKTAEEFAKEEFKIKQEYLDKQTELVIDTADRELNAFIDANRSRLDANQFLTDELVQQETERLNAILDKQKEFEAARLQNGLISQTEYNDAINALNEENRAKLEALEIERAEAKKEQELIDLENKRAIDEENFLTSFEIASSRLEQQRQAEIENAERTGADIALINKKFDLRQQQLDEAIRLQKVDQAQQTFGDISNIAKTFFGESKELSSALALVDTYLAAQKAYLSQLVAGDPTSLIRAILAGASATASGLANVAQINGIKFERGGFMQIGGKRHSQGGTKFIGEDGTAFEAEQGELIGVLNRRAAAAFMKYNNSYLSGGQGIQKNHFANGGIVERQINTAAQNSIKVVSSGIDSKKVASELSKAFRELPNPVVAVTDINEGQDSLISLIEGANI